jgi:hypothetical protein
VYSLLMWNPPFRRYRLPSAAVDNLSDDEITQ